MKPTGPIDQSLAGHGAMAHAYHKFLRGVLPIDRWEEIGELPVPLPATEEYPVDWDQVHRWAAVCPSLAGVKQTCALFDTIALRLGWHYAWSRFAQHVHLLDVIEKIYGPGKPAPTLVLEPGCFTGGLMHFLAECWPEARCAGLDLSPVSLDVCGHYTDQLDQKNRPFWLEVDFAQVMPQELPYNLGDSVKGGLVIISNMLSEVTGVLNRYPYLDGVNVEARLVAYWVSQGCTVLVAERHEDPMGFFQTMVNSRVWGATRVHASIMSMFEAFSTEKMCPRFPLGHWFKRQCHIFCFRPSQAEKAPAPVKRRKRR